jgi:hypothetical protein
MRRHARFVLNHPPFQLSLPARNLSSDMHASDASFLAREQKGFSPAGIVAHLRRLFPLQFSSLHRGMVSRYLTPAGDGPQRWL